jgi:DNA-binding beta-propeller fold protein YncE
MTRTILELVGEIPLPAHQGPGGFDHAAVHRPRRQLYVAHTANNAVDVIDCESSKYLRSIPRLEAVAGALVCEEQDLVLTSNRGENTVGIFAAGHEDALTKVTVGVKPNGLAYDPGRSLLLAANVGDSAIPGSFTVSVVDVSARSMIADIPVAGRTRWTVFDPEAGCFYVNIAHPAQIAVIDGAKPHRVARTFPVAAAGPHGMDLDAATHRLFCACDAGTLVVLDAGSGLERARAELAGAPDVIFFNRERRHLYVAIGDPGLIEVFETDRMRRIETIRTEPGAHTLGFDQARDLVYAFLPGSHRALVFHDHD